MDTVKLFKALSDKTRVQILRKLSTQKEISCQELSKQFALSQPTLSHHYNKLIDAEILLSRRDGVLWFYRINRAYLKKMGIDIAKLLNSRN